MPILSRADAKDLSRRLHEARTDPACHCDAPHTDAATGKPYRLEPKPRGRPAVLAKYGFECVDEEDHPWGDSPLARPSLHVRVPLGVHGADHLGIDPATGDIVCTLCCGGEG